MGSGTFLENLSISQLNFVNTYTAYPKYYPIVNPGRNHHGFIYTLRGTETYHFRDQTLVAVPHSVIYIPRGESYTITMEGSESTVIVVDFETTGDCARPFAIVFSENNRLYPLMGLLEEAWNGKKPGYLPDCKALCYKLVGVLLKQDSLYLNTDKYGIISDAVQYLHQNYLKNDFRIQQLAEIAGISQKYFETVFYQKYGMPPKEYVIFLKMERAKELLHSEKLLIKDIAALLGYSDIYHFGKLFKAKTGYTPSQYKKKSRQ